jgi:hypothetical protein
MTHDSAVRIVVKLVPEIEKRGAAEVLAEHAYNEDLPPAQLEKLAQVYNTLRTVSHIDNAEEGARGDTVTLVDVPELVMRYATGSDRTKAAAGPLSFSTHDPRVVDLNRALKMELKPELQKAAGSVTAPMAEVNKEYVNYVSRELASAALLDLEIDLQTEMSKLAGELFAAAPRDRDNHFVRDISEFEGEATRYHSAASVKAAAAYLEKFAAPHRTKLIRFDYDRPLVKYAYEIRNILAEKLGELGRAVTTYEFIKQASTLSDEDMAKLLELSGQSPDADLAGTYIPGQPAPGVDAAGEEDTQAELDRAAQAGLTSGTQQKRRERDEDDKGDKGGKGGSGDDSKGGKGHAGDIAAAVAASPFRVVGGAVNDAALKADAALNALVSKVRDNSAQRGADMSVEEIRRAMNVRRLIGTDSVLKEADPKAVLEIYNAIAARNPEIAGDMAAVRLILREAVSYEGLTLDSQKLLTEIRRNSLQGQKESDELDRQRYAVGGAVLPSGPAKSKV